MKILLSLNPQIGEKLSFNEKLKIYAKKIQNPAYAYYTNKYEVKNYLKNFILL